MRKIILIIMCVLLGGTHHLFGQIHALNNTSRTITIREQLIKLGEVDQCSLELTSMVSSLPTDTPLKEDWEPLAAKLKELSGITQFAGPDSLTGKLEPAVNRIYSLRRKDLHAKAIIVRNTILAFRGYQKKDNLQKAQLIYALAMISNLSNSCTSLRQYLLSLMPEVPDDLMGKIDKRIDASDMLILRNHTKISEVSDRLERELPLIIDSLRQVKGNTKEILTLLNARKRDTIRNQLSVNWYSESTFGAGYLFNIHGGHYAGGELLVPIRSALVRKGGFLLYGFRQYKLFFKAGAGYVDRSDLSENIAWKAGVSYLTGRVGLGLDYSPLTGTGIWLSYAW
jgi:hypothetical protein